MLAMKHLTRAVVLLMVSVAASTAWAEALSYPLLKFTRESITRVYDGDTFYMNWPGEPYLPNVLSQDLGIRLVGIDTAEMRSYCPTKEQKAQERLKALEAQAFLEDRLMHGRELELHNVTRDKYFRLDATLYIDGVNINELMVEKGLAVPYSGTTAKTEHWCQL